MKTAERRHWCLYCLLRTYFTLCSSVSIFNFEQVIAGWEVQNFPENRDGKTVVVLRNPSFYDLQNRKL